MRKEEKKVEYKIVCIPFKLDVEDLVKIAIPIQAPYIYWIVGYLVGVSKSWHRKRPNVHYIVEVMYAKSGKYHKYVALSSRGEFKGVTDSLKKIGSDEGFILIVKENLHHPMIQALLEEIKLRGSKK